MTALLEPGASSLSRPYWAASREGRFVLPFCTSCRAFFWYPRPACPRCLGDSVEWRDAAGTGVVHAVTVMHKPGPGRDAKDGPYVVAIVELAEGVRMLSNVVGVAPEGVSVGTPVRLAWHELSDGRRLPMFTPDAGVAVSTRSREPYVDARVAERDAFLAAMGAGMTPAFWAARQPDVPAILSPHGTLTFGELNAEANRVARAWRARGAAAGDAVAAMISNRPEFVVVLAAAQRSGLRLTPINWHLTSDEAAYIVDDCEARVFVADRRFAGVATAAAQRAARATVRMAVGGAIAGFEELDAAAAGEDPSDLADPQLGGTMLYTSGTTGRPKGVRRSAAAAAAAAAATTTGTRAPGLPPLDYRAGESLNLCTGPLYHAAPLAFSLTQPLLAGAGVVLMDGWSAAETLALVEKHRITHSHMVPTMFHRLLALPEAVRAAADVSSLRYVWHGAAPCPVAVKKAILDWWGPVLLEYYAATEGTGTFVSSEVWLTRPGTVGLPPAPDHVRILGPGGEALPAGQPGTIYLKAPREGRFDYFKDPGKTADSYRGDYFTLGDVGYLDDDGYLFLTDRSTNLIISGGVNVYPAEVEAELLSHPAVGDAAVIGVPDEEWGESVLAVVEPTEGIEGTEALAAELIEHCRARLARYKCPRRVDFVDALPRGDNGKLYKRRLRDEYRARAAARGPAEQL